MEFERTNFSGFTTLGIVDEIQKMMAESKCEPEQFNGRIIFMSMYNDIVWGKRGNHEKCMASSMNVAAHAKKSFHSDVGYGTESISASQMVNGSKLLKS